MYLYFVFRNSGETVVDMTFGGGGHSEAILRSTPDVRVFGLDRDPTAYNYAKRLAGKFPGQFFPLLGRFSELPELLHQINIYQGKII